MTLVGIKKRTNKPTRTITAYYLRKHMQEVIEDVAKGNTIQLSYGDKITIQLGPVVNVVEDEAKIRTEAMLNWIKKAKIRPSKINKQEIIDEVISDL